MISLAGCVLGLYFFYGTDYPTLQWVPLAALIVYTFGFAIGLGPITWLLASELFPVSVRHYMNPLGIAYSWFCVFLVTKSFPLLRHEINIYGIFWLYAAVALVGFIFIALFVPETKGKSIQEIRDYFRAHESNKRFSSYSSSRSESITTTTDVEADGGILEEDATKCLTESI